MMQGAVGVLVLSALLCLGSGLQNKHDHETHASAKHAKKNNGGHKGRQDNNNAEDVAENLAMVKSANRDFAFNLYRLLANQTDNQGKNIFFSPSSVSLALAALSVGARGQTHQQLFSGLGFNSSVLSQQEVNKAFRGLLTEASEDISAGTAVFMDKTFKPLHKFLNTLSRAYQADGRSVDFTNATESVATINQYVEEKTNGKINQLVTDLDADTLMYLISYIYFKGKWKTRFDPGSTEEMEFYLNDRTQVMVQMMNVEDQFSTYYDKQISTWVLRLPFNSTYSMLLMLPDEGRGLAELERNICPVHYAKWLDGLKKRREKWNISLPKFSIKTNVNLNDVLSRMGITDMFGAAADFSGISEDNNLSVSQVEHQATLDVDEAGATATAVVSVGFVLKMLDYVPELSFDRPFMVLIADPSDNILFMGKILNPNL